MCYLFSIITIVFASHDARDNYPRGDKEAEAEGLPAGM